MAQGVHSGQRGFLDFSPTRRDYKDKENDVPVLSLIQFSKAPFVTFGSVKLGTSKSAVLRIENPTEYAAAEVSVDKIPSSKGFSVDFGPCFQPGGSFTLVVTWTPTEEGGIRELIVLNASGVLKHQAVLLGRAEAPKRKKKTLWDTIKSKREGEKMTTLRRKVEAYLAGRQMRRGYLEKKAASITLQAAFRGMRVRAELKKKHQAATVIQALARMFLCRKRYLLLHSAAIVIQSRYRALLLCRVQLNEFRKLKQATVKIQAVFRGFRERRDLKRQHKASRAIQAHFRMHRMRVAYLALKCASIIIQERYRAKRLMVQQMQSYRTMKHAVIVIQAAYRGHKARRKIANMHQAASVIQRKFLAIRDRKNFLAVRVAVLACQQRYRAVTLARKARLDYLSKRRAVVCLQAAYRGYVVRKRLCIEHMAAVTIQSQYRMYQQKNNYKRLCWAATVLQTRYRANKKMRAEVHALSVKKNAAVVLQAAFRGMKLRQMIKQKHQAASVIQRAYRAHCEHREYLTLKSSVLTLQRRYRASVAAKKQLQTYQKLHRAAVVLQAAYRGQQVRQEVAHWHQAATVIQSAFRKHREVVKFQAMRLSAIIIQRRYQAHVLQRHSMHRAATVIQANFRRYKLQSEFRRQRWATCVLQQRFRAQRTRNLVVKHYQEVRKAAIILQAAYRGMKSRQMIKQKHQAASVIQRTYRAHCEHREYLTLKSSVLTVQRRYRASVAAKKQLQTYQKLLRHWLARRHKAATVIQQAVWKFLLLRRQKRVQQGILKAQALWRGHCSRRLNDNPKIVKLRHRLRVVTASVREEDKLCNKTSSALDYLLRYKHFSYILEALKNLETATRLSPECCERLVESGATNVIFTLIRCCNRSVPCMDVITFSIQILLNLSKYHKTIEAVYSVENSVETLLDLLQRYREKAGDKVAEKGGSIFTKACFLLALLLQDKQRTEEVKKLPKVLDRIHSIYRLTARKHKMDTERTIIKQKMSASINGSFFVPVTFLFSFRFAPDWVLRRDKLKDIVDPLRAIQMVANTLSIVL
uniref:Abnormal spindle-like microcephaly-associated protein ASH domain-containing protein n=1 Tax=Pundamilia nyererei TaxID=303518 RepID=A0A3B4FWK4_9CICH